MLDRSPPERPLKGVRVLLLEDEPVVAMNAEAMLGELGADVLGPAHDVPEALSLIEQSAPTVAVLDVNLRGGTSYAVADRLRELNIPFVFASGYMDVAWPGGDAPTIGKPYTLTSLRDGLVALV